MEKPPATKDWKILVAESVPNVYFLEGGINHWLAIFGQDEPTLRPASLSSGDDRLHYLFPAALGDRYQAADPGPQEEIKLQYTLRLKFNASEALAAGDAAKNDGGQASPLVRRRFYTPLPLLAARI